MSRQPMLPAERSVLAVIPTFDNAASLADVLAGVLEHVPDVLVVDDGSSPQTAEVLKGFPSVHVIRHDQNQGKGAALRTGLAYAARQGFATVISIDADGQHFPKDLSRFLRCIAANPGAIIIGARDFDAPGAGDVPGPSRFGRAFSNFWVWVETGVKISDTQSGFRAYPIAQLPLQGLRCRRYDFEAEILTRSIWAGVPVVTVPISVYYPPRQERISHFHLWKDNAIIVYLHAKLVGMRLFSAIFRRDLKTYALHAKSGDSSVSERRGSGLLSLLIRIAPISVCYMLVPIVLLFYYATGSTAREGIADFYQTLDGDRRFPRKFRNFIYFSLSLIDRMALAQGRLKPMQQITAKTAATKLRGPAILIGAHLGDWNFCGSALSEKSAEKIAIVIDMRLTPKFSSKLGEQLQQRFIVIDASGSGLETVLKVKATLDDGGVVCFLGDRPQPGLPEIKVPFLGRTASFPLVPYELACRLSVPIYSFFCLKTGYHPRAPYAIDLAPIWDGVESVSSEQLGRRYVAQLEEQVRKTPQHWFNFFLFLVTALKPSLPTSLASMQLSHESQLSINDVVAYADQTGTLPQLSQDPAFFQRISNNRRFLERRIAQQADIYGVTTGFGSSSRNTIDSSKALELQHNLAQYHGCGVGPLLSERECAASLLVRLNCLARGTSGVTWELLQQFERLLQKRIIPAIPAQGSVGASGDLTPLSYIVACLEGERQAYHRGHLLPARQVLDAEGLAPYRLKEREALAVMNGTSVMSGLAALAWAEAKRTADLACEQTGLLVELLKARSAPFTDALNKLKPHPGQLEAARRITLMIDHAATRHDRGAHHPMAGKAEIQDAYSLRCAPQIIGVLYDVLAYTKTWIEIEINSTNDNPAILDDDNAILNGGLFYGGHIAAACDALKTAVANVINLLDRQFALMLDSRYRALLPENLVAHHRLGDEAVVHHSFKAMQITMSALAAEIAKTSLPMSIFSRPTEGANQDVVSMGTIAARELQAIHAMARPAVAIHAMALRQAFYVAYDQTLSQSLNESARRSLERIAGVFNPVIKDRALDGDIRAVATALYELV